MSSPPNNSSSPVNRLDTMFLRHLIGRLQVHDSDNQLTDEDFISDEEEELEYENEDDKHRPYQDDGIREIYEEESRIEAEVVYRILNGKSHTLKPNSGETVTIRESSIAVGFHVDEEEGEYVVWEWHGHIPRYTEEHQFSLEYIYGNYFQRVVPGERPTTPPPVDAAADKGLKDLFDGAVNPAPGRILHRNLNIDSTAPRL
ncbi:uncharacterized protein LOC131612440 [Vicia villosa]|uniref:uncharacterized protein LOC131612440 n=1 Tax=Vicia villosa TaxID=3911 RepID=UPI00273C6EEA|nr:uncharacterized protein LOC131612440 [Vicia villosa]